MQEALVGHSPLKIKCFLGTGPTLMQPWLPNRNLTRQTACCRDTEEMVQDFIVWRFFFLNSLFKVHQWAIKADIHCAMGCPTVCHVPAVGEAQTSSAVQTHLNADGLKGPDVHGKSRAGFCCLFTVPRVLLAPWELKHIPETCPSYSWTWAAAGLSGKKNSWY